MGAANVSRSNVEVDRTNVREAIGSEAVGSKTNYKNNFYWEGELVQILAIPDFGFDQGTKKETSIGQETEFEIQGSRFKDQPRWLAGEAVNHNFCSLKRCLYFEANN